MIHRPGRSVGRSHRSHRRRALLPRSGGMSECLSSGAQSITQQRFHVSGRGTPSRPGIARQGRDRLYIQSRLNAPSDGVHRGGLARRRIFESAVVFPAPGGLPLHPWE